MAKDIEREISAHEIDCKIDQLKERFSVFFDEDEVENLIQLSMNLGKLFANRDLDKKLDGSVVVPVEPTDAMLIAADNCVINGKVTANNIYKAMLEAARGGK
jgi:glutamate-1-semialdehyde aminotransferase